MPTIRDAAPDDALAVAAVHVRAWQVAYRGLIDDRFLGRLRPEDRAATYTFGSADPTAPRTIVAESDGEIWGFATVCPCRDQDAPDAGEISALYVDPSRWRTGTGRRLLEAATSRLRDDGYEDGVLWVLRGNERAQRFYEADGWRRDGAEREERPYGVVSQVARMRRPLAG
jgi:GNAT superfamily N-acetyltransferase